INGRVLTSFSNNDENGFALALQPDGKILEAGMVGINFFSNNENMGIARFNTDGKLDSSFGVNGEATIKFENGNTEARNILLQQDGKIILTGRVTDKLNSFSHFALARLNADGNIDSN